MADIETSTVSEEGYACTSQVGEFDLQIDATDETGPNPNAALVVATYAGACYLPVSVPRVLDDDDDLCGSQRADDESSSAPDARRRLESRRPRRADPTTRPRPTSLHLSRPQRAATTSTPTSASTRARSEAATRHFNRFFRRRLRPATRSAGRRRGSRSLDAGELEASAAVGATVSVTSQPWASAMRARRWRARTRSRLRRSCDRFRTPHRAGFQVFRDRCRRRRTRPLVADDDAVPAVFGRVPILEQAFEPAGVREHVALGLDGDLDRIVCVVSGVGSIATSVVADRAERRSRAGSPVRRGRRVDRPRRRSAGRG